MDKLLWRFGRPQQEYNPNVHGPYHPGRWYGKPDTPLRDVKLMELGSWLGRRSKNPIDWARAFNRAWWRWSTNWMMVRKPTAAPIVHLVAGTSAVYYLLCYKTHTPISSQTVGAAWVQVIYLTSALVSVYLRANERHAKYHW